MGRRSEEIGHMQETSCLSLSSYSPTRSRPTTLGSKRRKLSVGGVITPILCAAGVHLNKRRSTPAGWMDIKFCKTNLLIEHKELDGKFQFNPPIYTLVGHETDLQEEEPELDRVEDRAESQAEDRVQESADLGEPECYYFEEYEAPRMNPSVVAAHKRIGLLQKFNKWQGKAMDKMQKSMDKMVSKIKSLEKKVSGSSSKKKKAPMAPTFPRSRSLLTTPRRLPAQEPHRASSFEPREGEDNSQRRRKSSKAIRSSSTTGLDRCQVRPSYHQKKPLSLPRKNMLHGERRESERYPKPKEKKKTLEPRHENVFKEINSILLPTFDEYGAEEETNGAPNLFHKIRIFTPKDSELKGDQSIEEKLERTMKLFPKALVFKDDVRDDMARQHHHKNPLNRRMEKLKGSFALQPLFTTIERKKRSQAK
ncbi:unnamed protein product [Microthlaspi erraticum]|uniref:Arabidopsis retrotransposon Orf1 C-terminal domain-containing protein n=1 Tax=Microthlaspi erraticum TaxID=1685480 RepID=A0A6D2LFY2_9BRAS|nr:unnamed protein product [Microthlaspi erraticum]